MNQTVAKISIEDALKLNSSLSEPNKVAFQNAQGTEFFTYIDIVQGTGMQYTTVQISSSVINGTFPVFPRRKMFPR